MTTSTRMSVTSADQLVEGARALIPALLERRAETDESRLLPQSTVDDIVDLGILGAMVPTELGGSDLGARAVFDACVELARGSGSAAWVAGNWAVHGTLGAMFTAQARDELFGPGLPRIATAFSPFRAQSQPAKGGSVISGQWDFASGINHSEWIVVQALTEQGPVAYLAPTSEFQIHDNWDTTGLRGTGSSEVSVSDLFVPAYRQLNTVVYGDGNSPGADEYGTVSLRLPLAQVFGTGVVATVVGCAIGAVDAFTEHTVGVIGGLSGVARATRPEVSRTLGEASADIEAAIALIHATIAEGEQRVADDVPPSLDDRVRWRRNLAWGGQAAARALSSVYEIAGAKALYRGGALEQSYRDGIAASHHFALDWDRLYVGYGELMTGATTTDLVMI